MQNDNHAGKKTKPDIFPDDSEAIVAEYSAKSLSQ